MMRPLFVELCYTGRMKLICCICSSNFERRSRGKRRNARAVCSSACLSALRSAAMTQIWRDGRMTSDRIVRNHKGSRNPRWRGGAHLTHQGYRYVWCPEHPRAVRGKVLEHRLVMERTMGRRLLPEEIVHHINGDKSDNRPENLELFASNSEHVAAHGDERERDELGRFK